MHYFDNAASSWPKPPQVIKAMMEAVEQYGANPGRGSHQMAVKASRILFETRMHIAKLIGISDPNHISFAYNTTMALNQAIKGYVRAGDHVICTNMEHNSVRRPLEYLKSKEGVQLTYIAATQAGTIDEKELQQAFQKNTRLIVCNHSSNLLGSILDIETIASIAHQHGVAVLVDGAQTLGSYPLNVEQLGIDMLAFPGHKGLLGPQGTGGLYVSPKIELEPYIHGGTGSQSEEIGQPSVRPDKYEAGTQNTPGIAGLNEGVKFILNETVDKIHTKEWTLTQQLMQGLSNIDGVSVLGPPPGASRTGIVSFTLHNMDSAQVAYELDREYNIAVRAGYHCTPLAHEAAGTLDSGAVRASVGYFTTSEEVEILISAMREIVNRHS